MSQIDAYIGYMEPYATSHAALDKDAALQEETRNAARALVQAVKQMRTGELKAPDRNLRQARPKQVLKCDGKPSFRYCLKPTMRCALLDSGSISPSAFTVIV